MTDSTEVLFISDIKGNIQCVNPHVGTTYVSYRGAVSVKKNCLATVAKDYLVAAEGNKPLLQVWYLNSQMVVNGPKLVLSGIASALAISPDGLHCVAAVDSKLYVWKTSSGTLLRVLTKHFGTVEKVLFLDDSVHFVSCGESGVVMVWRLSTLWQTVSENIDPIYSFSHHTLKVTDVYVSPGGLKGRLYTSSLDFTCKIYDLRVGNLLLSINFDKSITAIKLNCLETKLYAGSNEGSIVECILDPIPRSIDYTPEESALGHSFQGHTGVINKIDISIDGFLMATAADDGKVIIWDIPSRLSLRSFDMKGPATNAFFSLASKNIFTHEFSPSVQFAKLHRVSSEEDSIETSVYVPEDLTMIDYSAEENLVPAHLARQSEATDLMDYEKLQQTVVALTKANKELYQFAMSNILDCPASIKSSGVKRKIVDN